MGFLITLPGITLTSPPQDAKRVKVGTSSIRHTHYQATAGYRQSAEPALFGLNAIFCACKCSRVISPPVRLPAPLAHWLPSGGLHNPNFRLLSPLHTYAGKHSRTRVACQLGLEEVGKRGLKTLACTRAQMVSAREECEEGGGGGGREGNTSVFAPCPSSVGCKRGRGWMNAGDLRVEGNYFCRSLFHCLRLPSFNGFPHKFVCSNLIVPPSDSE
ncbi:hypothetical protein ECG_01926 [Echinococcus granulosus]|uniref:Uncharacterized protein n=1 Tax=Echinococcus granulosus TaxID=6210 RepID=A0A068W6U5_ECHGR|nr:hypothetical protein ECG_01926 [Echinococcus granulosus]CDS15110.1 hypothetical protein EgrG_000751000 [Echinococcus granulosus]